MKKSVVLTMALSAVLLIGGLLMPAAAQVQITQVPTPCTPLVIYQLSAPGGAFSQQIQSGNYLCTASGAFLPYGGGGGVKQVVPSNVAATSTATTFLTYPVLANANYTFSCDVYWQNSGANATTFTLTTPSSPTSVIAFGQAIYAAGGTQNVGVFSGSPLAFSSTSAGAGSTTYKTIVSGTIFNGANAGNVAFQISAATGTATVLAGSTCAMQSNP